MHLLSPKDSNCNCTLLLQMHCALSDVACMSLAFLHETQVLIDTHVIKLSPMSAALLFNTLGV